MVRTWVEPNGTYYYPAQPKLKFELALITFWLCSVLDYETIWVGAIDPV